MEAPRAPRSTSWTSASSGTSERRRPKHTCIATGRGPRFHPYSATAQQLCGDYAQHETCACWRDAARPRLTSSRADRGLAGRDLCATRGGAVELDAVDPYARGVLARARRPGAATSCAKLVRRRRDFWVKLPRARRERSTARRALAAPAVVNDGAKLCACCIVPDSRRRRRGFMFQPGVARSALEKSLQDAARGVQAAHASSALALDGYRDRLWLRPSRSSTRRGGAPYHRRHRESAASQQRAAGPDRTGYCTRAGGV